MTENDIRNMNIKQDFILMELYCVKWGHIFILSADWLNFWQNELKNFREFHQYFLVFLVSVFNSKCFMFKLFSLITYSVILFLHNEISFIFKIGIAIWRCISFCLIYYGTTNYHSYLYTKGRNAQSSRGCPRVTITQEKKLTH